MKTSAPGVGGGSLGEGEGGGLDDGADGEARLGGGSGGGSGGGGGDDGRFAPRTMRGPRSRIVWLNCPFAEKDAAKAHGAQWDPQECKWYVPPGVEPEPLSRWIDDQRLYTYLRASYADKDQVKALGARFDGAKKAWYVPGGKNLRPFARWLGSDF